MFPELAEKIGHRCGGCQQLRGSERQRADRAHLLLELTRDRGVERQVSGIVRPRRDLVDEQLTVGVDEEFDAQHPDVLQLLKNVARNLRRARGQRRRNRGGSRCGREEIKIALFLSVLGRSDALRANISETGLVLLINEE